MSGHSIKGEGKEEARERTEGACGARRDQARQSLEGHVKTSVFIQR